MEERVQKILAKAGYGSRRACEEFIIKGRVTVNGQVATLGMKADPQVDRIELDGKTVNKPEPLKYIAIYKPRGVISAAKSPEGRRTVVDLVKEPGRLYPVGRLDADSEGLILLTNDGELTNKLTHPRYGHEKEYRVLVAVHPEEEQMATWRRGVVLEEGYRTAPTKVRLEGFDRLSHRAASGKDHSSADSHPAPWISQTRPITPSDPERDRQLKTGQLKRALNSK
jgi:23S rRNA pseudouridine2605 synthase